MNLKEKAEIFAIKAHDGQIRKADPEKPYVIHPIDVGNKLEKYGFGREVVAAGKLHDVAEDTDFSIVDIKEVFGENVASLVRGASETSKLEKKKKELSWEERKKETIERLRNLDLEHKAIACADKISNLEDIIILSGKTGRPNFDGFKRGFEDQKWYYENVYQSLIHGHDKNLKMFQDLRKLIDLLFYNEQTFHKSNILYYQKQELLKLRSIFDTKYPNLEKFYFLNCDLEIYNDIKLYFQNIEIQTENLPYQYFIIGAYPQISYYRDGDKLSIKEEFYYKTMEHNANIHLSTKKEQAKLIVDTLMKDLYQESLNTIKLKIKEKKIYNEVTKNE
ncbi:MAG: HD domain-containing protein [Erysipelotrichaceae bacterium]|nr:HD domain-containing protein [Erysipelotrichaceae bacterium]